VLIAVSTAGEENESVEVEGGAGGHGSASFGAHGKGGNGGSGRITIMYFV
jgi:hypothetical protein